ncbi:MAG: hypothetical protein ACR2MN_01795 [Acidimicrobiales bacterium]
MDRDHRVDSVPVNDRYELDSRRRTGNEVELIERSDKDCLVRFSYETEGHKPVGRVGGLVVGVELPLPITVRGEPLDLILDHSANVAVSEIAPGHPAPRAGRPDDPGDPSVTLDRRARLRSRIAAHLLIEDSQHLGDVHDRNLSRRHPTQQSD